MRREFGVAAAVEVAALLAPMAGECRGGDFHLVHRAGAQTAVIVGDVIGKGEDAAPYADRARAWLEQSVREAPEDPAAVLEYFNTLLLEDATFDRYLTACAMIIDAQKRSASWALAGHLAPHWLDIGLPVDSAAPGYLLGAGRACGAATAQRGPLRPGQGFCLFTDGLEDVVGPGGDRFGSARVTHTLATSLHGASPKEVVHGLKRAACDFGGGELYDDICIAALRLP